MAGYGRGRATAKLGGSRRKLALKSDMRQENLVHGSIKRNAKQAAHKKV